MSTNKVKYDFKTSKTLESSKKTKDNIKSVIKINHNEQNTKQVVKRLELLAGRMPNKFRKTSDPEKVKVKSRMA